ncbi:MAG: hypothetical protein FJ285_01805 [Planctomycetes bacterium]|nr:hypothetical protein [Planctomycetota bacterium]
MVNRRTLTALGQSAAGYRGRAMMSWKHPCIRAVYAGLGAALLGLPSAALREPASQAPTAEPARCEVLPALARMSDGSDALVVRFAIAPQWHMYWSNPGDSGAATSVIAALPQGWTAGAPRLPRPQILGSADERLYGYEKTFDVLVPVVAPVGGAQPSILVRVQAGWMVCKDRCQTGKASLSVQVSTEPVPYAPTLLRSYPLKLPPSVRARIEDPHGERALLLTFAPAAIPKRPLRFVPDAVAGLEWMGGTGPFSAVEGGREMILRLPFRITPGDALDGPPRLRGLLLAGDREGDPVYQVDLLPADVPLTGR